MIPTRLKLVALYVTGLLTTSVIVATAVFDSRTSGMYAVAGGAALANAELALGFIRHARQERGVVLVADSLGRPVLAPRLREQLNEIPGYVVVTDQADNVQFVSADVQRLGAADWTRLRRGMADLPDTGPAGILTLSDKQVLLVALRVEDRSTGLQRVIAGLLVNDATAWPPELTVVVFVVVPLLIGLSGWGAWRMFGPTFARVERVRREVADITDGRSLHRRLSTDEVPPELTGLIGTLNAMIERLEGSFMTLRRFTADASHELKTPLAVLRADIERAMSDRTNEGERMVALEEALQETTRMTNLVESLLTLARADEGRFDLRHEPVALGELVREVYETAAILGEAAGVTVSLPFTTDVTVTGDRARLRQLFLNLVTNAIKYTPPGGRVDLGLGRHPETATFAVRDTGVGIAAAELPHVFERFWRADRVRSRTSERGGFGLGLAISQWIAQSHGGTLTVSSRLGKGSLFTVTLPLPPEERATQAEFMNS